MVGHLNVEKPTFWRIIFILFVPVETHIAFTKNANHEGKHMYVQKLPSYARGPVTWLNLLRPPFLSNGTQQNSVQKLMAFTRDSLLGSLWSDRFGFDHHLGPVLFSEECLEFVTETSCSILQLHLTSLNSLHAPAQGMVHAEETLLLQSSWQSMWAGRARAQGNRWAPLGYGNRRVWRGFRLNRIVLF